MSNKEKISKLKITVGDIILIMLVILISIFFIIPKNHSERRLVAHVYVDNEFSQAISLYKSQQKDIHSPYGMLTVEVKEQRIRVVHSTCPNKVCVHTGWISKKNESITCLPNAILIILVEENNDKRKK